ncbi:MAG: DNA/RNA nuclease SfsA [Gammaproteobacteria bacterium]
MYFNAPLLEGRLIRRYKRFLADVRLADGTVVTAHTPNTGSMLGCAESGSRVWLRDTGNTARKYPLSWDIVEAGGTTLVGINTGLSNALVREAVEQGVVDALAGYSDIRSEVRYGNERSRIDLLLQGHATDADCYLEVKNVTLAEGGRALFPDAVSARGTKHLRELMAVAESGLRAALCFCVQRGDVQVMEPADRIDPEYGRTLRLARARGVEVFAYRAAVSTSGIQLDTAIPVRLPD